MQAAELAALYEGHRKRLESEQHHSATAESALASLTAHAGLLARQVAALQARLGWSEGAGGVPRRGWWKRRAGVPLPPPAQPHPREGSRSHPGVSSDVGVPLEDRQR